MALCFPLLLRAAPEIYVSPEGKDANPGTRMSPIRTLAHARDLVRAMLPSMSSNITVYFKGGMYPMTGPAVFTAEDSGLNNHSVVYRNEAGEQPVFSGGKRVEGWSLHDRESNIWMAKVSPEDHFRQIYVNGVKAIRASSDGPLGLRKTATGFSFNHPLLASCRHPSELEIVVLPHVWQQERLPVAAINGDEITIQEPCWSVVAKGEYPGYSNPQRIENAYEFLTKPGYWYLDRQASTLYYIPRAGEKMESAVVEVPIAEQLLVLTGSASAPVCGLQFSGIAFRLTNWLQPSTGMGFPTSQANQPEPQNNAWTVKAALDCTGARQCAFQNCRFQQLGGNGINVLTASQKVFIERCSFQDVAGTAIQIGRGSSVDMKLPKGSPDIVSRININNCTIHDVATDYQSGCGIFVGLVQDCTISHNELYHLPYTAISIGWGWGTQVAFTSGNKILSNKIHDHMQALKDGGGIYCNGYVEGGLIQGNHISKQGNIYGAYYLDDGSTNWIVKDNVCEMGRAEEWYLFKGHNNHASNNFTDNPKIRDMSDHKSPCTLTETTVVQNGQWPANARSIMDNAGPSRGKQ